MKYNLVQIWYKYNFLSKVCFEKSCFPLVENTQVSEQVSSTSSISTTNSSSTTSSSSKSSEIHIIDTIVEELRDMENNGTLYKWM